MRVLRVVRAVLREIFDESAYERYCAREGLPSGRDSFAKFLQDADRTGRSRVRCC